jgi:16S rRNA (cytosine967-C5)-methyltransferase
MRMRVTARSVALEILESVLDRSRPLDDTLDGHAGLGQLEDRDRAFARVLAATTLRRLGQIDALITGFMEKPLPPKARGVKHILRLGLAQLLFLGTPAHAAVDTAVDLAKDRDYTAHKKFVNAVLRRADREGPALAAAQDAARLNLPDWLWHPWCAAFGEETVRQIATVQAFEPPLDISVAGDPAAWAEPLEAELLPTGSLRRPGGGAVRSLPGFDEGAWWVQDAAAALPVRLLGDVTGRTVADLCAAPGGKTLQLAAAGAKVTAIDRSAKRLERVAANLARCHFEAELVAADAQAWRPETPLDAVLLDAPCSATGTLRRHPDIAWLKHPGDVAKLADLQRRLLAAATEMVRPGGMIVYCVCSLQPEEGAALVDQALADGLPLQRRPIAAEEVGGLAELISEAGDLRTLPCHLADKGGMDGFYAARLVRR